MNALEDQFENNQKAMTNLEATLRSKGMDSLYSAQTMINLATQVFEAGYRSGYAFAKSETDLVNKGSSV